MHCGCKNYLKIAKYNICCEAFPLLSLPPPPALSPLPSCTTYSLQLFLFLSWFLPAPCPGLGSLHKSLSSSLCRAYCFPIAFLKVSGTQHCTHYPNRILLGIQAGNRGLFLALLCNSSGSATHNSSDYKLLPGTWSAFCPRLLLSRCFTPIEFGFGVIFPAIQELYSSGLVCIVASYPQLQSQSSFVFHFTMKFASSPS